jgi:hypothetical protein
MHSDHSTSPTSSEDEETKIFKLERFDGKRKLRSCSVSSATLQPIPEAGAGAEEEDRRNLIRRSGSITRGSKSKRMLRKSVSPRNNPSMETWSFGVHLEDDFREEQRSYNSFVALEKQVILEEETEAEDKVASPRISLVVDRTEQALDKKRRPLYDSSESIQEERNEEEKIQTFRHSELIIGHCDEFSESPRSSLLSIAPPESIKEEDEGVEERIMLKHDDFIKRITNNDEQYLPAGEILRSSLQEVREEDEDQGLKEN